MPTPSTEQLLNRLRLRQAALLIAIDDRLTLRAAAAQLGMSQPAASKMLRELEEAVGEALFERVGRGLRFNGAARQGALRVHHLVHVGALPIGGLKSARECGPGCEQRQRSDCNQSIEFRHDLSPTAPGNLKPFLKAPGADLHCVGWGIACARYGEIPRYWQISIAGLAMMAEAEDAPQ